MVSNIIAFFIRQVGRIAIFIVEIILDLIVRLSYIVLWIVHKNKDKLSKVTDVMENFFFELR
jgi:hypothetical protein